MRTRKTVSESWSEYEQEELYEKYQEVEK